MKKLLPIAISILLFTSCDYTPHSRVVYDETEPDTLSMSKVLEDTTRTLVVALPIDIDSTDIIIHPVGWEVIKAKPNGDKSISSISKSKSDKYAYNESFWVNYDGRNHFHGNMVNLIFENTITGTTQRLTDKLLNIRSVTYLRDASKTTGKQYLLYKLHDKDYNQDGVINAQDLEAYYMSYLDGTRFTKITQDYHFFSGSGIILKNNRFYFQTIEDVNKDGIFNRRDKYHYYYIDLKEGNFTPTEYFPLELINAN